MTDPIERDRKRRWSGAALQDAAPQTADLAEQLGLTDRAVRYWKSGETSPLTEFLDFLESVHEAGGGLFPLVAHVQAFAKYLVLRGMSTTDLLERHEALVDAEHDHQARQDRAIQNGDCPTKEGRAIRSHAAILSELDAVKMRLAVLGVDPADFRRDR